MMAAAAPVLIMIMGMGMGMGIEVSQWAVVKLEMQRAADTAARAGALDYYAGLDPQRAANAAASLSELNGVAGSSTRAWTWNGTTGVLADNQVAVTIGPSTRTPANTSVGVTVSQAVPLVLTKFFIGLPSVTISASAWAELSRAQPCLLALDSNGSGITSQGNPNLALTGCTVRSNSTIATGGSATMSAPSLWAKGTISGGGITGTLHPNSGTVPDPYASDAPVVVAFNALNPGAGTPFANNPNTTNSLSPDTYSGWNIKGRVTLSPGIYYVNGNISLGAQATLSGAGVTIVTSGTLSETGGAAINLTAALSSTSTGAIPGVVFAGNSSSALTFGGNTAALVTGVIYYPNGSVAFNGTPQGGSSGCLELIAASISLQGNSKMSADCGGYGALSFGDLITLALVR